jgi:hypothetical protein
MNNLQVEAQFTTGGTVREPGCMGEQFGNCRTTSPRGRIGETPIPTVKVWMKEDMTRLCPACQSSWAEL